MKRGAFLLGYSLLLISGSPFGQGLESLVSPGELSKSHRELEGLESCERCHTPGQGVDDHKCLACHEEIARRIEGQRGFHRTRGEKCSTCHPEHRGPDASLVSWDPAHFDHRETGYPLVGFHNRVERCEECHSPKRFARKSSDQSFLLADSRCVGCHDDVHKGTLGVECTRCHQVERKFVDVRFDHDRAAFHLRGAHRDLECSRCHQNGRWKGIAFSRCTDCHTDRHRPTLGADCSQCHTLLNWGVEQSRSRFHAEGSAFPLEGKHAEVQCRSCHPDNRFKGIAFAECRSCHTQDPHQGQFDQDCSACHVVQGFEKTTFNHQLARFHLTGKHLQVECAKCHLQEKLEVDGKSVDFTRFRPLKLSCGGCHRDVHLGQLGGRCETCHSTFGFDGSTLTFSHDTRTDFPLEGAHLEVECAKCHRPEESQFPSGRGTAVRYSPLTDACRGCHQDPHAGQLQGNCERCHTVEHFLPASRFDHQKSPFPLTGRHLGLECRSCHPVTEMEVAGVRKQLPQYRSLAMKCSGCHEDPHRYADPPDCVRCHSTKTFSVQFFNHFKTSFPLMGRHAEITCESCHRQLSWRQKTVLNFVEQPEDRPGDAASDSACVHCHQSPHRSRYESCERCHTFSSWRISDW